LSAERLLIGLGNELRGDDAAGLLVARAARRQRAAGIGVVEREGEPIDLIGDWERARAVVVADAVDSGGEPGRVYRVDAATGPLPAAFAGPSTHALGLADAIELARALDRLPDPEGRSFWRDSLSTDGVLAEVLRHPDLARFAARYNRPAP
jgi:hydrogenase maturation protease